MKVLLLTIPFVFTSCILVNSGNVSSGPILNANDQYVDNAVGVSENMSFILYSGFAHSRKVLEAKQQMFRSRPLQPGEYYSNLTCDISRLHVLFGIFIHNRITVSADVMRSAETQVAATDTTYAIREFFNLTPNRKFIYKADTIWRGEQVFARNRDGQYKEYFVHRIKGFEITLRPVSGYESYLVVSLNDELFSVSKRLFGIAPGEQIRVPRRGTARVLGVSGNRYLVDIAGEKQVFSKAGFE